MRLPGGVHLTYCTNVHPAEDAGAVYALLDGPVAAVKARVAPDAPLGLGLWLSRAALAGIDAPRLRDALEERGLYLFTLNAFPYGRFHGAAVKRAVYRPDWSEAARLEYTLEAAALLAALIAPGEIGSLSTLPGAFRAGAEVPAIAAALRRAGEGLAELEASTGRRIILALEPEPGCLIETSAEAAAFFERHLPERRHLGVCLDGCHAAVEWETPAEALAALDGIPIAKVQLSSALELAIESRADLAALAPFDEPVYLHQVVRRTAAGLVRHDDLGPAIAAYVGGPERWRVHFHVSIFLDAFPPFRGTRAFLEALLARQRHAPFATHFEVETYTWGVLPPALRDAPLELAIARELDWARGALAA